MITNTETAQADEIEIRRLIGKWSDALEARDAGGLTADYAPEALLFDAIPPYKRIGADAIREAWEHCLPYFPEAFKSEHRDIAIHVDGDVAFVHGLHHIIAKDHPAAKSWLRVTVGYRRIEGHWKVVHEHVSLPFNPLDDRAWPITDPDANDQPDYSQGGCGGGEA